MRLDVTLVLYWASLGMSAAAVVLFVWLMREERARRNQRPHPGPLPEGEGAERPLPGSLPEGEGEGPSSPG